MKPRLAAAGIALGVLGGAAAGVALGVPGLAGAQSDVTTTAPAASSPSTTAGDTTTPDKDRSARLGEILAPLVSNGTITQAQADAVIAAIEAARPADGGRHGPGGRGIGLEAAASALGMTETELHDALESGKTVAEVAQEKGVDLQKVIDAMVAAATDRLNQAVTDGKLTQAEADERLADVKDRVTQAVNGELPARGGRGHGPGMGHDHDADDATPTTTAS